MAAGVWLIKSSTSVEKELICLQSLSPGSCNGLLPGPGLQGWPLPSPCSSTAATLILPLGEPRADLWLFQHQGIPSCPQASSVWAVQPGDSGDTVSHCHVPVPRAGNIPH